MNQNRIRIILKKEKKKGPILYWMSRDQRVNDNWALIYAQQEAIKYEEPVLVLFCLQAEFMNALARTYRFMIESLKEVAKELSRKNITFIILKGPPETIIPNFIKENSISKIITDFSPLRIKKNWINNIRNKISIPFYEVDTHNIIPIWKASDKKEYAAYTLRPKIKMLLDLYLEEFPEIKKHPYAYKNESEYFDWEHLLKLIKTEDTEYNLKFKPGEKVAMKILLDFINNKLNEYKTHRNNPNFNATSNLSPYLHFGQISAQRIVLETMKAIKIGNLKGSIYDEIIVRRELSDNFCYYEPDYDNFNGFHPWAKNSLNNHRNDRREYIYSLDEFVNAKTHDNLWNAAQLQMVKCGKMHGYLRMYWCKKILEWTKTPEDALKIAIFLNDKYELDGRDPNGYTGIAWSIGGVHDRAWNERRVYGKIRYMSYKGMKKKFNIEEFIDKIGKLNC
ncbi:MAG: deoxyribodipyrimidine photo-lyase [Candidatus Thorarchaeota archaeon]